MANLLEDLKNSVVGLADRTKDRLGGLLSGDYQKSPIAEPPDANWTKKMAAMAAEQAKKNGVKLSPEAKKALMAPVVKKTPGVK